MEEKDPLRLMIEIVKDETIGCDVNKDFAKTHPESVKVLSKLQLFYSLMGLMLGVLCIIGGILLFLNGIIGSVSWSAELLGNSTELSDAAPGTVLFIVGLFIVVITKFDFKISS